MTNKTTESKTLGLLLEVFFDICEPEFEWNISEPYLHGDHPDIGGGSIHRDIEGATFVGTSDLSRSECVELFGKQFVIAVEDHALAHSELFCGEDW